MNRPPDNLTSAPSGSTHSLTSGRLLARNTIWNLLGLLLPMAVGVVAIPPLVRGLGVDRFGLLALAWIVIGYFSLFDLGIGRALTKLVADKLGANEMHSIPPLAWTSLLLMLLLGVLGGTVTAAITPWLVGSALKVPPALKSEALYSFYLLAASIPMVTVTSGLRGILEAQQRFRILNLIRIPTSIFSFVGPLLTLPFSHSLVAVIIVLIAGRLGAALAHLLACLYAMPVLRHNFVLDRSIILPAVRLGGWMTVSNVIGPLMVYMDRFLIGAWLSVSAVAYYAAPFDVVTRLTVLAGAIAGVLFPAFAVSLTQDPDRAALLLRRGVKYVFLWTFPLTLIIAAFAPEELRLWLGGSFAANGTTVLRWLAAGVFVNSLAHMPFGLIQGAGRPDITAKLHLLELPLYLLALRLLVQGHGIQGAAIAWTGRIILDTALLFFYAYRILPQRRQFQWSLAAAVAAGLAMLYMVTVPGGPVVRGILLALSLGAFITVSWSWGLAPAEREFLLRSCSKISLKQRPAFGPRQ